MLSAEILYRDDIEVEAIVPSFIASAVGYTIFGAFQGYQPMFGFVASGYNFSDPGQLGWYALIGIVAGAVGLLYSQTFHRLKALFARLPVPAVGRPVIGGLLVGAIAVALPEVLGIGYGWIQKGFGPQLRSLPLAVVSRCPSRRSWRRRCRSARAARAASSDPAWSSARSPGQRSGGCSNRSPRPCRPPRHRL